MEAVGIVLICVVAYLIIGGMFTASVFESRKHTTEDFIGVLAIWPLFVIKGILWGIWSALRFLGGNAPKWWIIPKAILALFVFGGRQLLFGIGKARVDGN